MTELLEERGKTYGEFSDNAALTQGLKAHIRMGRNWRHMDPDMQEALDMIMAKAARILNGDPEYKDSWVDIAGYATLIANRL